MRDELSPYARLCDLLPEGHVATGFVVTLEAITPDGNNFLYARMSQGMTPWKAIGMTTSTLDDLRDGLRNQVRVAADDEDGDDDFAG